MAAFTPRQTSRNLNARHTQVFLQTFADCIMVLVTQMGKVGNLIQATLPSTVPLSAPTRHTDQIDDALLSDPSPAIQLTPLLGGAPSENLQTLYFLYASQIATIVWKEEEHRGLDGQRRNVVIGLALQNREGSIDGEREVFEGIVSMLLDLLEAR